MKKRLHDKKAGIAILTSLIVLSLVEVIFRLACMRESLVTTSNAGEPLASAIFAIVIIFLTFKGKDRACFICYGAWLACFVLDQAFGFPGMIAQIVANATHIGVASIIIRVIIMCCIIAIGALVAEYINDGTIYNRAFNVLCIIVLALLFLDTVHNACIMSGLGTVSSMPEGIDFPTFQKRQLLLIFNNLHYMVLVFLFTFFAYDSAKAQLKKTDLAK